jgi:hypothetical protein
MEANTKKNLIIWGVVLLVLLNVSSLSTIWFHRYQYTNNRMNNSYNNKTIKQHRQRMGRHSSTNNSYFTRDLNLSNAQQTKFDSIWAKYSSIRNEIEQEMTQNRELMNTMMGQLEVDTTEIYKLSANQGTLMQELDLSMIKMNLALRSTLDEKQMQTFLERIETLSNRRFGRQSKPGMKK